MAESKQLNYMGIDEEGRFVCVSAPTNPDLAKEISKWIKEGLSVERCCDEFVRKYFGEIIPEGVRNR